MEDTRRRRTQLPDQILCIERLLGEIEPYGDQNFYGEIATNKLEENRPI
jgi:hypothetical protein